MGKRMARQSGRNYSHLGFTGLTLFLIAILVLLFGTRYFAKDYEARSAVKTGFTMGTLVKIKAYGPNSEQAVDKAFSRIREIENEVSVNLPDSEVSRLNAAAGKAPVHMSRDSMILLKEALRFAQLSGGRFDPTVGPLVKMWGIGTDRERIPSPQEIEKGRALVNYHDLIIDEAAGTAFLRRPGMSVDLGAIAKGYAGDEVIRVLRDSGIRSGYVDLGGNVIVLGNKPDGTPWRVGIQDPRGERGDYVLAVSVADKSLVTSGDYERYFEKNGVRYHHILDPFTGQPSRSGLISATIISDRSIEGDGLSTTVFLLGPEKGLQLIESLPGVEAVLITADRKIIVSSGLRGKVDFTGSGSRAKYERPAS